MGTPKKDHLQGSLDLLVLRTLASHREPLHGYAITEHIHRVSREAIRVEEGSLYPALHRMDGAGWITAEGDLEEYKGWARDHAITRAGPRRVGEHRPGW